MFDLDRLLQSNIKFISGGLFTSYDEWIHPKRIIDSFEIIVMVKGTLFITEGQTEYQVQENEILILKPGVEHFGTKSTSEKISFYWIHLMSDYGQLYHLGKQHFPLSGINHLTVLIKQLLHYANTPEYPQKCMDYVSSLILVELMIPRDTETGRDPVSSEIREWIKMHYDKKITLDDISKQFGYNKDYLTKLFKNRYHIGIKQYIAEVKMTKAKELILSGKYPLKKVSEMVGIEEYNHFLKMFKYHEGVSPNKYRQVFINTHFNKN